MLGIFVTSDGKLWPTFLSLILSFLLLLPPNEEDAKEKDAVRMTGAIQMDVSEGGD